MSTSPFRTPNVSIHGLLLVACLALAMQPGRLAAAPPDSDGDGVVDDLDNCLGVANPDQADPDQDGYGTACDGDLNNDGGVGQDDVVLCLGERPGGRSLERQAVVGPRPKEDGGASRLLDCCSDHQSPSPRPNLAGANT